MSCGKVIIGAEVLKIRGSYEIDNISSALTI